MSSGYQSLTEREKQTLRLILRGHDAKSVACALDLSVHTINERLREARRKLAVTSSREAARLLDAAEGADPQYHGDRLFGAAMQSSNASASGYAEGRSKTGRFPLAIRRPLTGGLVLMSILFAAALLAAPAFFAGEGEGPGEPPAAARSQGDAEVESAARDWLAAIDRGDIEGSYTATGTAFRKLNSVQQWGSAYAAAHGPLGPALSRHAVAFDDVAAPPAGYKRVRFQSTFAGNRQHYETVTLEREDGRWKVVGIVLD